MTRETVTLSLPPDLVAALRTLAQDRHEALDDLARGMFEREVSRLRAARTATDARDIRLTRLRNLLGPDLARATGWDDLRARLALYGVEIHMGGGGPMLHDLITGEPLCASAALGFGGPALARRFGGPMPVHMRAA